MDLVIDPFAGSNTTGAVAERLCQKWIAMEQKLTTSSNSPDGVQPDQLPAKDIGKTLQASANDD